MSEPEFIAPRKLRPEPIRNESQPAEFLEQIKAVSDLIGPYFRLLQCYDDLRKE